MEKTQITEVFSDYYFWHQILKYAYYRHMNMSN